MMQENTVAALLDAGASLAKHMFITGAAKPYVVVPDGYSVEDVENLMDTPQRPRGKAVLTDSASFCNYVKDHDHGDNARLYADVKYQQFQCAVLAILNDNRGDGAGWRDHTALFDPVKSVEWKNWVGRNGNTMKQAEFAAFLEENMGDIVAGIEGMPSGAQILDMALKFEATCDKRFKSKVNLQGGGVELVYVDQDDAQTQTTMRLFERFTIGLPVFEGSDARYALIARLKYRHSDGKLMFWYELVRPDKVFKDAVADELMKIQAALPDVPMVNGTPGVTA